MKIKELIVGKWYTNKYWNKDCCKFISSNLDHLNFNECIKKGSHSYMIDWWSAGDYTEVSYSEIKQYLPKDYKFKQEYNKLIFY